MSPERMRTLVSAARVGRLATIDPVAGVHQVPFCFALHGNVVYSAVDHKPKSTTALRRLDNIRADPRAAVLVDHYEEDWTKLWWVRLTGSARILVAGGEREAAVDLLCEKYPQYAATRPDDAVLAVDIRRWSGWEGSPERFDQSHSS